MTVRAFAAIFPPRGIQEALHRAALALPVEEAVRYVRPENIHLTMKFLGDVQPERLAGVEETLASVGERHEPFEVALAGVGAFPSMRRGRVLWVGVSEGSERLSEIATDMEDVLESLGFEREPRAYRPHATLGRARGRPFVLGETAALEKLTFRAETLTLVQSLLRKAGATYEPLGVYPLVDGTRRN
ncbi:MAG TPA: RNA 2',3'-cyclic phosphodiesterase [Rubrobacteraceae bacterium]|nr:RNA 2',3'-cyclic phosphodiesterase [Rubrobacteraceae bacterium]